MRRLALFLIAVMVLSAIPLTGIPGAAANGQTYPEKTTSLLPIADAYSYYYKGTSFSWKDYHSYYDKRELAIGNSSYYSRERTYLKFNLSEIPPAAEISSAQVCVYVAYIKYLSTPMEVGVYNTTDTWSEDTTPSPVPQPGNLLDTKTLAKGWVCWDVTSYIQDEFYNGDKIASMILKLVTEDFYNYAWIYSKENSFDQPYLKVDYYIPISIKDLQVPSRAIQNYDNKIKVVLENGGKAAQNVTFLLYIDGATKINETIELPAGGEKTVEYIWRPQTTGMHEVKAEIEGYDFKSMDVEVIPHPDKIARIMSTYYLGMYMREWKSLNPLYENFTWLLEKVRQYNISMGEFESEILGVEGQLQLVKQEYQKYLSLKRYSEATGSTSLSFAAMRHIRRAAFLSRGIKDKLEHLLPLMQSAVEKAESGQTGVTIKVTKVLIDASHGQYYSPTKSDSNGMSTLIGNIENELGWKVDINTEPITYEKLKNYNVLIITNPSKDITDEEAEAIQQFVENGGGLFILGESYYGKVYYKSLNKVVGKYGIEFKNDELMDDDKNTGRPWFPLVGLYNLEHPAMKFLNETHEMLYNGDTLDISGDALWLITGYETAYSEDKDKNVVKEKGSKPVVAAAVEAGSGRIVAYGSSKAISDAYYQRYINTNWPFVKGVLLWLAHAS